MSNGVQDSSCGPYFLSTQLESNPKTSVLSGSNQVKATKSCTASGASYAVTFPSPRSRIILCASVLIGSRIRSTPPETKKVSGNALKEIVDSIAELMEAGERYGFFVGPSIGSSWRGPANDFHAHLSRPVSNLPITSVSYRREESWQVRWELVISHNGETPMRPPGTGRTEVSTRYRMKESDK